MLLMLKAAVPVLVSVTVCAVLVLPVFWLPKLRLLGLKLTTGETPVPLSATFCGLSAALSVMVTLALREPLAEGVKVTVIMQVPLAARLLGQLLVWVKSLAFVPVTAILLIVNAAVPLLVSVTV